jgi:hypothetical protein
LKLLTPIVDDDERKVKVETMVRDEMKKLDSRPNTASEQD